jgi:predicted ATPase
MISLHVQFVLSMSYVESGTVSAQALLCWVSNVIIMELETALLRDLPLTARTDSVMNDDGPMFREVAMGGTVKVEQSHNDTEREWIPVKGKRTALDTPPQHVIRSVTDETASSTESTQSLTSASSSFVVKEDLERVPEVLRPRKPHLLLERSAEQQMLLRAYHQIRQQQPSSTTEYAPHPCISHEAVGGTPSVYQQAFQRRCTASPLPSELPPRRLSNLIVVSGTGKTTFVEQTLRPVVEENKSGSGRGYFVVGRFDSTKKGGVRTPFSAWVQVFHQLIRQIVEQDGEVERIRHIMLQSFGGECSQLSNLLVCTVLPALRPLLSPDEKSEKSSADETSSLSSSFTNENEGLKSLAPPGSDASMRDTDKLAEYENSMPFQLPKQFVFVLRILLKSICSPKLPIVIMLENIDCADPESLETLSMIVTDDAARLSGGVIVVATTSGFAVPPPSPPASNRSVEGGDYHWLSLLRKQSSTLHSLDGNADPGSSTLRDTGTEVFGQRSSCFVDFGRMDNIPENASAVVTPHIILKNLSLSGIEELVSRHFPVKSAREPGLETAAGDGANTVYKTLARFVFDQTGGNTAYVYQYLDWLQVEGLLSLDSHSPQTGLIDGGSDAEYQQYNYIWDDEEIRVSTDPIKAQQAHLCVEGFILQQLQRLPTHVQDVLKVSASLGARFSASLVSRVLRGDTAVSAAIDSLLSAEHGSLSTLRLCRGNHVMNSDGETEYDNRVLEFSSDVFYRASYRLVDVEDRPRFHLEIGRRLFRRLSESEVERHAFALLRQLYLGRELIDRQNERLAIASLCLHGGRTAAQMSGFGLASLILEFGIDILGTGAWNDHYDLSLALHNSTAEMEMATWKHDKMNSHIDTVLQRAHSLQDKVQAYSTRIYSLSATNTQVSAIVLATELLSKLGVSLPRKVTRRSIAREVKSIELLLQGKSDEDIRRLPAMSDSSKMNILHILHLVFLPFVFYKIQYVPIIVSRMIAMTVEHGMNAWASTAFCSYGFFLMGNGDAQKGFRFGDLGKKLLEDHGAIEYVPRVFCYYYGHLYPWRHGINRTVPYLRKGHRIGMQTGDVGFAAINLSLYFVLGMDSNVSLQEMNNEWECVRDSAGADRLTRSFFALLPSVQLIHHLMGLTPDPLSPDGDVVNLDEALKTAQDSNIAKSVVLNKYNRSLLAYTFNDYESAAGFQIDDSELEALPKCFFRFRIAVLAGLVAAAMARKGVRKLQNIRKAKWLLKELQHFVALSPELCSDRVTLLEAEVAAEQGRHSLALHKYISAVALSKQSESLYMIALSNERTGIYLLDARGDKQKAYKYFKEALQAYGNWGAVSKTRQLKSYMENVFSARDMCTMMLCS